MGMREVAESSNKELVSVVDRLIPMSEHLAIGKKLVAVKANDNGSQVGFFKKVGDTLQVHMCVPRDDGTKEWHRFFVLDATDDEQKLNKRLNILR